MSDKKRFGATLAPLRAARRTDALFKAMSTDFLLREQFVTEPTQLLAEYVHGRKVPEEQAEAVDQLLYAVLASDALLEWFRDYAQQHGGKRPDREQLARDFSTAVVETGARHVVLALARASVEKQDVLDPDIDILSLVFEAVSGGLGGRAVTEMSTGHTTGTEMSTGHVFVTEMSTGHTTGTEMSTGHVFHTEMSTGHTTGTEMSTGHVFHTEMSTGHTTGTEMSTGHVFHTEMSTGHTTGTEMSTGHLVGFEGVFRAGLHRATFAALVDYARELRDTGRLDVVFARTR
jgi:hypothetical protein